MNPIKKFNRIRRIISIVRKALKYGTAVYGFVIAVWELLWTVPDPFLILAGVLLGILALR